MSARETAKPFASGLEEQCHVFPITTRHSCAMAADSLPKRQGHAGPHSVIDRHHWNPYAGKEEAIQYRKARLLISPGSCGSRGATTPGIDCYRRPSPGPARARTAPRAGISHRQTRGSCLLSRGAARSSSLLARPSPPQNSRYVQPTDPPNHGAAPSCKYVNAQTRSR